MLVNFKDYPPYFSLISQSKVGQLVPVSEESKEKVLNCYLSNPKRTLNCSAEVRQYTQCVEKARQV